MSKLCKPLCKARWSIASRAAVTCGGKWCANQKLFAIIPIAPKVDVELATLDTEAGEASVGGSAGTDKPDEQEMLVMELLGLGHRRRRQADDSLCCTCQQGPPGLDGCGERFELDGFPL